MAEINKREFGRLKILDSIRGIAALLVLYHHIFKLNKETFQQYLSANIYYVFNFIQELNHEAVLLFFIISGFSIGLSTFKRPLINKAELNGYLYRRFKRILPIYWLAILLSLIIGLLLDITYLDDFNIKNLVGNLLFLQTSSSIPESWAVPYGLNGPLWSLAFEIFFYLLFPLVYFFHKKYFKHLTIYVKFAGLILLALVGIIINKKMIFIPYFLFIAGFITWIQGYISSQYFTTWKKNHLFFLINFVLSFALLVLHAKIPSETIIVIAKGMLINSLFYFVMVLLDRISLNYFETFLNDIFFKIGEGSYAIYALHYPLLIYCQNKGVSLKLQLLILPIFIITCYHLEKYSIKWKMKFLNINYVKPLTFLIKKAN